jgi:hypothetical protein
MIMSMKVAAITTARRTAALFIACIGFAAAILLFPSERGQQELLIPGGPGAENRVSKNMTYSTADYVYPRDIGYYDVRKYGAKGDGITDDTSAIKSAMAASLSGSNQPNHGQDGRGGTVYFPSGTYLVTSTLLWGQFGNSPARITASVDPKRGCVTGFKVVDGGSGYYYTWGGPGLYITGGGRIRNRSLYRSQWQLDPSRTWNHGR